MFTARFHYGSVLLAPPAEQLRAWAFNPAGTRGFSATLSVPATRPIDDMISFSYPPTERQSAVYLEYAEGLGLVDLGVSWAPDHAASAEEFARHQAKRTAPLRRHLRRWNESGLPASLLRSARTGTKGRLDNGLLDQLGRVRFIGPKHVEAPDLPALAAWCLSLQIQDGGAYTVRGCDLCGVPFVSSGRSRYCRRWQKEATVLQRGQSCQEVAKVRDYRERKRKEK